MTTAVRRTLLVMLALTLGVPLAVPLPRAWADPWVTNNPDGTSTVVWNFSNAADYTASGTRIAGGTAALAPETTWWNSTSQADFGSPDGATNATWTQWPGDVALSVSSGPATLLALQPGAAGEDTWLDDNNPGLNHGADTTLILDGRNPDSYPLLRFDISSLPVNVVIDDATLSLYQSAGFGNSVNGRARLVTNSWVEGQATWNDRFAGTPWTTPGGDFSGHVIDQRTVDNIAGWKTWNVTVLADLWHRGRAPNYGLILEAPNPGNDADKTFYSSDYNVDPTRRPRLDIRYRTLGVAGEYVSAVGGPGTSALWQTISWNTTTRSLATDEFDGPALDSKWTWTNPPASYDVGTTTPGHLHTVSTTGTDFFNAAFSGNVLANNVVGNFTATMKFSSNPTASGQKAGLMVLVSPRDWYAVWKANLAGSVNWRIRATADAASTTRVDVASGNPVPAWVRIQRSGTTFTAYTSADGSTWTLRDTHTPVFEYPLAVRIAATFSDGLSGTAHTVDVDYVRITFDNDATVSVSTRTGDVTPVDGSWTGWSAPHPSPAGSAMAGTSRYVSYRLSIAVTNPDHVPTVGDVNISWFRYSPSGTVETSDFIPPDLAAWGTLTAVDAPNGQTVAYAYSLDSGVGWTPVSPPVDLSGVSIASGRIRFRVSLSTSDTLVSPTASEIRLTYTHRLDHFEVTAPAGATAGAPFSVTVAAKDALNATITSWTGTVTLAPRLADGVTPGGGILGVTNVAIAAGGSATVGSETYTKAETIRIHASAGPVEGVSGTFAVSPGPVVRVTVTPDNATLLPFDAQVFTAAAFDTYDNPVPTAALLWTVAGGIGNLNSTTEPSVLFTASPPPANGTLTVASGPAMAVAQIRVVSGIPPWIAISAPATGGHVTGVVPIAYTNSSDAVTVAFDYDDGLGWSAIGSTAALNGTYLWDTSGLDFSGGSLRAIVTNNRTISNATVVSPLEVDNTPPSIAITGVTDNQAGNGTLTVLYATDADVARVDLAYFDGGWNPIGSDLSIDGSYVWAPGTPINGVTLRAVAVDEVDLRGADEMQGVGNLTVGVGPPAIAPIPDIHIRAGTPYTLNLTFYVSDPDTPLSALVLSTSDPANVSANAGPYPSLDVAFAAPGTFPVTLWVSDGTDTAWTIVRVIASAAQGPPSLIAAVPPVAFDEDTTATNAFASPATAFFNDPDTDPLTFSVLDGVNVLSQVNGDDTVDLWARADWFGSETLRLRATDPSGGFAEAAFQVTVRPVGDAPVLVMAFPAVSFDEDTNGVNVFGGNATLRFLDVDGDPLNLTIGGASALGWRVNPDGSVDLWAPANWSGSETLRVRATDPSGAFAEGPFLATVRPVNDAPLAASPPPAVTFDEDTAAVDAFGGPASGYFTDVDGDTLTYSIVGSPQIQFRVNADRTMDVWAVADWFGTANVRLRAQDPGGAAVESALLITVRPVNDAPLLAPIADLSADEGATVALDLAPYITDVDTPIDQITASTDSPFVTANARVLTVAFPADRSEALFTITVSDGAASASRTVRVAFVPPWWKAPYVLAMPPIGLILVVAMFAQRARWRPTKAFLVDERQRMLREFTLDPSCDVTYDQAMQAGALDAVEKPVRVAKYHAQTVKGDALAVVLLAYGPVTPEQVDFAREMLVNIQDKFEDAVKARLQEAHALEAVVAEREAAARQDRAALEAKSHGLAGLVDSMTAAQAKVAQESRNVRIALDEIATQEAGITDARAGLENLSRDLHTLETTLGAREAQVAGREAKADAWERELTEREGRVAPLEASLAEREESVGAREVAVQEQSEAVGARALELAGRAKELEARAGALAHDGDNLDASRKALEAEQSAFDAKVSEFTEEADRRWQALEAEAKAQEDERSRLGAEATAFESMRAKKAAWIATKEAELADAESSLSRREAQVAEQAESLSKQALDLSARNSELDAREAATAKAGEEIDRLRAAFDPERKAFEARVRQFEDESRRRQESLDAQTAVLSERQSRLTRESDEFESMRRERSEWIASKEIELEAKEESLQRKEAAVKAQAEENAQRLADLGRREEGLEIEGDRLEKARAEVEGRKSELARLAEALDVRATKLTDEEARRAEEFRTWQATMESQQALLRQEREAFDREATEAKEAWAMRTLQLQQKEADLTEREAKVRADVEYVLRSDEELKHREAGAAERLREAAEVTSRAEALQKENAHRAMEIETRERRIREEAAKLTDQFARRNQSLRADEQKLASARAQLEADVVAKAEAHRNAERTLLDRAKALDDREAVLAGRETKSAEFHETLTAEEARLARERADLETLARQLDERQSKIEQARQRGDEEAARFHKEAEAARAGIAAKEADLRAERERLERESTALQETLGGKAQELTNRERALSGREADLRAAEEAAAARTRELDARARQIESEATELGAKAASLEKRRLELEAAAQRHAAQEANARMEWEAARGAMKAHEEDIASQERAWTDERQRSVAEFGKKERELAATFAKLEETRLRLEDAAKAQAAKDAEAAEAMARAEKRFTELKGMEADILRTRQAFEAERAAWAARRADELKQLEATRDAVTEQAHRSEQVAEEARRRALIAGEAEKAAKRQTEELAAARKDHDARRAELERIERALDVQTQEIQEASNRLAAREMQLTEKEKGLAAWEARLGETGKAASRTDEQLKGRKAELEREAARLAKLAGDLDARSRDADARIATAESRMADVAQRERVLMTELQRSETLMEDLTRKDTDLKSKEAALAVARSEVQAREAQLAKKEGLLDETMKDLERTRHEVEARAQEVDRDRATARAARDEALTMKTESEAHRAQLDEREKEVQKSTKFLQKKAVDALDKEEALRAREDEFREQERSLEARAEILDAKERTLEEDRAEMQEQLARVKAENEKLRAKLASAEKGAVSAADLEEQRKDIDARVKIVQRKAFDLLDREEKLRKKEEELRALAERLGVRG